MDQFENGIGQAGGSEYSTKGGNQAKMENQES